MALFTDRGRDVQIEYVCEHGQVVRCVDHLSVLFFFWPEQEASRDDCRLPADCAFFPDTLGSKLPKMYLLFFIQFLKNFQTARNK